MISFIKNYIKQYKQKRCDHEYHGFESKYTINVFCIKCQKNYTFGDPMIVENIVWRNK